MGSKTNDTLTRTSRFLSYILRHHPESVGLTLDSEGWADVAVLLDCAQRHGRPVSRELLQQVVDTNDKKRFTLSDDGCRIRAAQGHSTAQVAIEYAPRTPPVTLYHGTATRFLDAIAAQGLLPGSRHHVHLSADVPSAAKVGSRHGKPAVLAVDAAAMQRDGLKFHLSDNGVWLTDSVPPQYLRPIGTA